MVREFGSGVDPMRKAEKERGVTPSSGSKSGTLNVRAKATPEQSGAQRAERCGRECKRRLGSPEKTGNEKRGRTQIKLLDSRTWNQEKKNHTN